MGIAAARKMPEDVAKNLLRDEVHSTLIALGVPLEKVKECDAEMLAEFPKVQKMTDKQAFARMVEVSKSCLLKLGVEKSLVDGLQFE